MTPASSNRPPAKLSTTLQKRLNAYTLAAGAAGVSVLALAQPAGAKVVYKRVNKSITPNNTISLDLNHDHHADFNIYDSFTCTSFCEYVEGAITAIPLRAANRVRGYAEFGYPFASALMAGVEVGPNAKFFTGKKYMVQGGYDQGTTTVGTCFGAWDNVRQRFLGLKFKIGSETHYGWARFNASCAKNGENTGVLTGYAYETIAKKPIVTGDTGGGETLGRLAHGAHERTPR